MSNPWDVRPTAARGDADPGILFQSVGQALTEWAHIETCYAEIYAIFVGAKGRRQFQTAALRAYGSIPSISTQLSLVQYAAEVFFHKHTKKRPLKKTLDSLISDTKEFTGRRNEIAHGQVSQVYVQAKPRSHKMQNVGYFLLPSLYHPKKYKLDSGEITYQYHSSDLIYYRQEFTKLQLRVASYREQLKS